MIAAAAAVAFVAGCSSSAPRGAATTGPTSSPTTSATATTTTVAAPDLSRFYRQHLHWRSCGGGFQCSSLLVPLDYAHPDAATMKVAVIRARAAGSRRGSLVVNPGGPGASGVDFARNAVSAYDGVMQHLDLVSFDPRGVGRSKPIRCLTTAQLDAYFHLDFAPVTAAARNELISLSRGFADDCWSRNHSYLAHVGTIDAARDMDVLRAALGDRKLTYYGASYGTYLGAKYAQLFPTRIRAMVLDGAVNPAQATVATDIEQSRGFETDLQDFIGWCVRSKNCPLGSTRASALQGLARLEARVRSHPEPVRSRSLGIGEFWDGLADGFYDTSFWSSLRSALARAARGDGAPMLAFNDDLVERTRTGYTNLMESNMAINCVDRESPTTVQGFDAALPQARKASEHFGAQILYSSLPCAFWRVPPVEHAHPVSAPSAPPIMVIGTTHDPATPYADAVALVHQLGSPAFLITLDGDGHTAYLRGDDCILRLVNPYLSSARVPRGSLRCR